MHTHENTNKVIMGGILKNPLPKEEHTDDYQDNYQDEDLKEFRQRVFTNTQLNAKLTQGSRKSIDLNKNLGNEDYAVKKSFIPRDTLSLKHEKDSLNGKNNSVASNLENKDLNTNELQWNQKNLDENEIAKLQYQDVHVDEPKTPYQGAMDPQGEYYKDDDDEDNIDNIDDNELTSFSLGEPQIKLPDVNDSSNQENEFEIENDNDNEDSEIIDQESKHKKFDELRKKHYNMKEFFHKK